ncbi:hypothetical protein M8818_005017 [Zalaria obscura]|uniref:Uncharacterized protein n=1 Tax=Zalaria obscura TaxID=2024903 RepID=A0ACC3SA68_9PEZI
MNLKRSNDGPEPSSPKRQKNGDFQTQNRSYTGGQHYGHSQRGGGGYQQRGSSRSHYNNRDDRASNGNYRQLQAAEKWAQQAAQADPLVALEGQLKTLTSTLTQQLSADGVKHAQALLAELSTRRPTTTSTLSTSHPTTLTHTDIPPYSRSLALQKYPLPPLPPVPAGPYASAPFTHKSVAQYDRQYSSGTLTYESLEFLGDAYIEIIATRLIFACYPHFAAGRQAQVREKIVKNDTLTLFSEAYGFRDRVLVDQQTMRGGGGTDAHGKAGKAAGKVLADVFEAYVAAVILSDPAAGFQTAEKWLTELWAPILLAEYGPEAADEPYNANAKQELQQRVLTKETRLEYREERPMEQSKHGQRFFLACYFSGLGYAEQLLGKGEGQNKVEAGNRAAMDAMGRSREVVEEVEAKVSAARELKKAENAKKLAGKMVKKVDAAEEP